MSTEFKAGDLVFEVVPNRKIKLVRLTSNNAKPYPVRSYEDSYTHEGYMFVDEDGTPSLFHATPENRQALVTLYGEDAVPELPPRGSDLTINLLDSSDNAVLVKISAVSDEDAIKNGRLAMATGMNGGSFVVVTDQPVHCIKYAVPVDQNGNEITELGGSHE